MLTTTHLVITVLIAYVLVLDRREWFAALTFGVLIDADHLFAVPRYVGDNGIAAILSPTWDDGSGLPWKSSFHYPEGAFIVGYLSIGWRYLLPLSFWSVHMFLDHIQIAYVEYSTPIESLLFAGTSLCLFFLGYRRWAELQDEADLGRYMIHLGQRATALLRARTTP